MQSFVQRLVQEGSLICPTCRNDKLRLNDESIECGRCHVRWPIRNRVPDFFNNYREASGKSGQLAGIEDGRDIIEELVDRMIALLNLPGDATMRSRVAAILQHAATVSCDDQAIGAEINDVLDRFFGSSATNVTNKQLPAVNDANQAQVRFERHYLPASILAGSQFSANIRLRNIGGHPWSSKTTDPLMLAATWLDQQIAPVLTTFPIDIDPGRAISLPVRLSAPVSAGNRILRISLVRMKNHEIVGTSFDIPIHIEAAAAEVEQSPVSIQIGPTIPDYAEDHADGVRMIEVHLKQTGRSSFRVLEVGSGTHPHLAWLEYCDVVALDINSSLLEFGSLYFGDGFLHRLAFICADAMNVPFRENSFDVIVMFSTLHHFPEPEILLARLAKLLRPGGLIAVMCEPVGDSLENPATLRDLQKGINEQVFSLDEYRMIFRRAGIVESSLKLDGGSLKALLQLNGEANAVFGTPSPE